MKLKTSITPSLFACFAAATNLNGKWTGKLLTANSKAYPLTYNFAMHGDSVADTAKICLLGSPLTSANWIYSRAAL